MPQARGQHVGNWGERRAAIFLEEKGYQVVARNVRTAYGEIDLVVRDSSGLVFVEVKTRTSMQYGFPEQAVTSRKMAHMVSAAQAYMEAHADEAGMGWRIDVVAILRRSPTADVEVVHFENVAG